MRILTLLALAGALAGAPKAKPSKRVRPLAMPMYWQVTALTPHSVGLRLTDSAGNPSGTTYTIYRANGQCGGSPSWAVLAPGLTMNTATPPTLDYTDTTVTPGTYCYAATATLAGVESAKGNTVQPQVPPAAPSTAVIQVQ